MAGQIFGKPPKPSNAAQKPTAGSGTKVPVQKPGMSGQLIAKPPVVYGSPARTPVKKPPMTGGLSAYKPSTPAGSGPLQVRPPVVHPGAAGPGGRVPRAGASIADQIFQNTRKKK